jgi:NADH dehydrogenase
VIGGKHLAAKTVIWTAGVAASPAGRWLGAEIDRVGRVKVNPDLSVPGHPNIFVIGDTSTVNQEDGKPVPGVAPAAMQEGEYVADLIADRAAGKDHEQAFQYVNKGNMATIGRFSGIVDVGNMQFGGFVGWVLWLLVHIYYLIGFRNRFMVMFQWVISYLLFQRGARLISFEDKARLG